jgi:Fe2+ transport system protein FeoA
VPDPALATVEQVGAESEPLLAQPEGSRVQLVERQLDEQESQLLAALGLRVGADLHLRSAGDPCIIEVRSTRIGLARTIAARLRVRPRKS